MEALREDLLSVADASDETMSDAEKLEAMAEISAALDVVEPDPEPKETVEAVRTKLDAAEANVEQLSTELTEKEEHIETLNGTIEDLNTQVEEHAQALEEVQTQLAETQEEVQAHQEALEQAKEEIQAKEETLAQAKEEIQAKEETLAQVQEEAQAQQEAMAQTQAELEDNLAKMTAYKVEHEPESGEAHLSTAVDNVIQVAADGVTGQWQFVNSELSGNSATISLTLDGETLYTSKALKPGEALESITLEKPLAPGAYKALAVSTVYDKSGEVQLVTRVPVTLNVAAE